MTGRKEGNIESDTGRKGGYKREGSRVVKGRKCHRKSQKKKGL